MNELLNNGNCVESGLHDLFFSENPADLAAAQALCRSCPARSPCLEHALEERYDWGVWGGVVFWDGQAYFRKRGRGRPRHADANLPVELSESDLRELVRSA